MDGYCGGPGDAGGEVARRERVSGDSQAACWQLKTRAAVTGNGKFQIGQRQSGGEDIKLVNEHAEQLSGNLSLAQAIFDALSATNPNAFIQGDPTEESSGFDVLIDGSFDFQAVAKRVYHALSLERQRRP